MKHKSSYPSKISASPQQMNRLIVPFVGPITYLGLASRGMPGWLFVGSNHGELDELFNDVLAYLTQVEHFMYGYA